MKKAYLYNNHKVSKDPSFDLWTDSELVNLLEEVSVNKKNFDDALIIKVRHADMAKIVESLEGTINEITLRNISKDLSEVGENKKDILYFLK